MTHSRHYVEYLIYRGSNLEIYNANVYSTRYTEWILKTTSNKTIILVFDPSDEIIKKDETWDDDFKKDKYNNVYMVGEHFYMWVRN